MFLGIEKLEIENSFDGSMRCSGKICPPARGAPLWPVRGARSVTLVRLREGILPLQKLLHFVIAVGKTPTRGKEEESQSPVWFKRHYFPSER